MRSHPRHPQLTQHAPVRSSDFPLFTGNTPDDSRALLDMLNLIGVHRIPSNHTEGLGDSFERFANGGNSGFAALQLAVILGFNVIGLLGFDGTVEGPRQRFHDEYPPGGDPRVYDEWIWMLDAYAPLFALLGVRVYNLSDASRLTAYERVAPKEWPRASRENAHQLGIRDAIQRVHGGAIVLPFVASEAGFERLAEPADRCYGGARNAAVGTRYRPVPALLEPYMISEPRGCTMLIADGGGSVATAPNAATALDSTRPALKLEGLPEHASEWAELKIRLYCGRTSGRASPVLRVVGAAGVDAAQARWRKTLSDASALVLVVEGAPLGAARREWLARLSADAQVMEYEGRDDLLLACALAVAPQYSHLSEPEVSEASIFIGTEPRMRVAEQVLHYSIVRHASRQIPVTWMDASRGGPWEGWDIGRPLAMRPELYPSAAGHVWYTDFSNFRWAVPEACGFKGRAIYMDVDVLVLGDLWHLLNLPMLAPVQALRRVDTSVMLFDCAYFRDLPDWPSIQEMKHNQWTMDDYLGRLARRGAVGPLPPHWNCRDGEAYDPSTTKLIHYSEMRTQPWRPYPDQVDYLPHPVPAVEALWSDYARMAAVFKLRVRPQLIP